MRSLRISIALADRCVATSNTLPLLAIHCPARPLSSIGSCTSKNSVSHCARRWVLLGKELSAHVPHAALVVCALGGLKEADAEQHVEAIPSLASSSASLETLRDALLREERVSFTYVSASGVRTRRIVDPWSLEASASGWLLRGWCTRAGEARSFAVASISDVRGEGPRVEEPRRMRHDAPTWTLDVDRDARWIADEYDGHIVSELDGGGARITLPVWNEQWGLSLLIDIAPHLPDMRDEAARRARSVLSTWTREDAS